MNWLSIDVFYPLSYKDYILYKIRELNKETKVRAFFYYRGFSDAFFFRFVILCDKADEKSICDLYTSFCKKEPKLNRYKIRNSPYVRAINSDSSNLSERLAVVASKTCLDLTFQDGEISSYFDTFLKALILNYVTLTSFLERADINGFLLLYTDIRDQGTLNNIPHFELGYPGMKSMLEELDLAEILNHVDNNEYDINEYLTEYTEVCKEVKESYNSLIKDAQIGFPASFFSDNHSLEPVFNILINIIQMNNNRMGIFENDESYMSCLLAAAIKQI
jgi:hypothetical protein